MPRCLLPVFILLLLSACSTARYQPLPRLDEAGLGKGYRFERVMQDKNPDDDTLVVMMFSGGGTRAAAFAYGVLEALRGYELDINGRRSNLGGETDIVFGISGGSVLAAFFAQHGADTIPRFEQRFLQRDFQGRVAGEVLSLANVPRLMSPQFGRGDLLQEQFEAALFGNTTFRDLDTQRKGPFAVISATDMAGGQRLDFTQDVFDALCVDLSEMPVARAVAASSAVPVLFAPLTLNNHGGSCGYRLPAGGGGRIRAVWPEYDGRARERFEREWRHYTDGTRRPYLHLLDGGLTDNLGIDALLDVTENESVHNLTDFVSHRRLRRVVFVSVNARHRPDSSIDREPDVPGFRAVLDAVINIPIDRNSEVSLRRFHHFVERWNKHNRTLPDGGVQMYFVPLNLPDLPEGPLRRQVMNIPTTFYLPAEDVRALKRAAAVLLEKSEAFRVLRSDFDAAAQGRRQAGGGE